MRHLGIVLLFLTSCVGEAQEVATPTAAIVREVPSSVEPVPVEPTRMVVVPERDRKRHTAVLLARVAINENTRPLRPVEDKGTGGQPTADAKAMIQEQVAFAEWKNVSLRGAIEWQSKYVAGVEEPKEGSQHAWTSTLPSRGDAMPRGWVECTKEIRAAGTECDGNWEVYADNWVRFRTWMIQVIVHEGQIEAECDGNPITWGCSDDDKIAINRGLCVIEGCGDRNTWWAFPGHGCDEPMREVLVREGLKRESSSVSAREIMKSLRENSDDDQYDDPS